MSEIRLTGVIVATVLPFTEEGEIDWDSYKRLLDYCAAPDGITSVFVNGHAGEGAALTPRRAAAGHRDHQGALGLWKTPALRDYPLLDG